MPDMLYVGLQDDDKIAVFALDGDSGELTKQLDVPAAGGPSVMAIGPDRKTLYVGYRTRPSIASYRINAVTGRLSPLGTAAQVDAPTFLAPDRSGRYMLCAYYQGGYVAVHPIAADGTVGTAAVEKQETAVGAHAIATDPSNRFTFVPHIARIQDNVLEPPKNNPGPNVIFQYRFDAQTGRLSPNTPHRVEQGDLVGPRHYIHHPSLDVVYFSNEQGCSVTAYRLDRANGTLSSVQTMSTLPTGHSERTTCSQIHLTPSGRFLYVGNRAANGSSIATVSVDPATGHLTATGHVSTEAVPSAFCLDPAGHFLFAVGTASGRLASYRINQQTGALTPLAVEEVGRRPSAVLATRLG
ncbi:MAG TPA: beta-propeller fold lactonase family protein [Xanthobacteraceae bacterium]